MNTHVQDRTQSALRFSPEIISMIVDALGVAYNRRDISALLLVNRYFNRIIKERQQLGLGIFARVARSSTKGEAPVSQSRQGSSAQSTSTVQASRERYPCEALPQATLDLIVDFVLSADHVRRDVCALLLVNKEFKSRMSQRIYSHIQIYQYKRERYEVFSLGSAKPLDVGWLPCMVRNLDLCVRNLCYHDQKQLRFSDFKLDMLRVFETHVEPFGCAGYMACQLHKILSPKTLVIHDTWTMWQMSTVLGIIPESVEQLIIVARRSLLDDFRELSLNLEGYLSTFSNVEKITIMIPCKFWYDLVQPFEDDNLEYGAPPEVAALFEDCRIMMISNPHLRLTVVNATSTLDPDQIKEPAAIQARHDSLQGWFLEREEVESVLELTDSADRDEENLMDRMLFITREEKLLAEGPGRVLGYSEYTGNHFWGRDRYDSLEHASVEHDSVEHDSVGYDSAL